MHKNAISVLTTEKIQISKSLCHSIDEGYFLFPATWKSSIKKACTFRYISK